jgi:hypothetical protein
MSGIALLRLYHDDAVIAYYDGQRVGVTASCRTSLNWRAAAGRNHMFNLCADRYRFMVGFTPPAWCKARSTCCRQPRRSGRTPDPRYRHLLFDRCGMITDAETLRYPALAGTARRRLYPRSRRATALSCLRRVPANRCRMKIVGRAGARRRRRTRCLGNT